MRAFGKYKKMYLLGVLLCMLILCAGGVFLFSYKKDASAGFYTYVTFDANGGEIQQNLFDSRDYLQHFINDDGDTDGRMSNDIYYSHNEDSIGWRFYFEPLFTNTNTKYINTNHTARLDSGYYSFHAYVECENSQHMGFVALTNESTYSSSIWEKIIGETYTTIYAGNDVTVNFHLEQWTDVGLYIEGLSSGAGANDYLPFKLREVWICQTDSDYNPIYSSSATYTSEGGLTNICIHTPKPQREGYRFLGYSATQDGSSGIAFSGDVWDNSYGGTYYAQWELNSCDITFDYGYTEFESATMTVQQGQPLPSAASLIKHRPGYMFAGFYTAAEGGDLVYDHKGNSSLSYTWGNDITLYARWWETWALRATEPSNADEEYIEIYSAKQLAWIAWQTENGNDLSGKVFMQMRDINLANFPWMPIGRSEPTGTVPAFKGSYSGNGYKITRMAAGYVRDESYYFDESGLFGRITESNGISSVTIEDSVVYGTRAGGVVGYATSINGIYNCVSKATVYGDTAGGIVGEVYNTGTPSAIYLNHCTNTGAVVGDVAGGIAGKMHRSKMSDCINQGEISAKEYGGGIVGQVTSPSGYRFQYNYLTNMGIVQGGYAGGLFASIEYAKISNCLNAASVSGTLYAGGLASQAGSSDWTACLSFGDVSGKNTGGLVGHVFGGNINMTSCCFKGSLEATKFAGGAVGYNNMSKISISQSYISVEAFIGAPQYAGIVYGVYDYAGNHTELNEIVLKGAAAAVAGLNAAGNTAVTSLAYWNLKDGFKCLYVGDASALETGMVIINNQLLPSSLAWAFSSGKVQVATHQNIDDLGYEIMV